MFSAFSSALISSVLALSTAPISLSQTTLSQSEPCRGMTKVDKHGGGSFYIDKCEHPGKGKPKGGVSFEDAKKACAARGARLCTVKEFSRACGGKFKRTYPYGDEYIEGKCNVPERKKRTVEVASRQWCVNPEWKVYDMVGNVEEWTAEGLVCGGSFWTKPGANANCKADFCSKPSKVWKFIGYRCCADTAP